MPRKGIFSALFLFSVLLAAAVPSVSFADTSKPKLPKSGEKLAELKVGDTAPDFNLKDGSGKHYKLSDYAGKQFVVLEWYNKDCPFVRKHYDSKNMQKLQETYTGKGIAWFQIVSSTKSKKGAKPKEGYLDPAAALKQIETEKSHATALLLDTDGKVGRSYGAKTTPHMFVISPEGKIDYMGAIDDKPTTDTADIATATNYVVAALDAELATPKRSIATASTKPYGCGVKY